MNKLLIFLTIISVVLVIAIIGFWQLLPGDETEQGDTDGEFINIQVVRTPCFGTCPAYTLEINAQGRVIYNGEMFVRTKGKRVYNLSDEQLTSLKQAVEQSDFFSLEDSYVSSITDMPSTTITIKTEDREKSVYNYAAAPERFSELATSIYEIAEVGELVECEDVCEM